jgi:crotonobetainyl-CoA:carnitine CoA-transferase CaiB-like acyl-CoA transferase
MTMREAISGTRPLEGVRVLEVGQLVAAPFAGTILAYFGAEVIKVEPPTGDPLRGWRLVDHGTSLWWRSIARNKKCVTLDLRHEEGRALAAQLAGKSEVLIESFRPGTMEKWNLGPDDLCRVNPKLIYARISGYGQTGPYSSRPGYASVCEGVGGFRYLNGFPDRPPVRPNLSLGDTLAGLHAALGIMLALFSRDRSGKGQVVDVAIYEAVFNMLESVVPEYALRGVTRERSGTTLTGIVPTNTYQSRDGKYVIIGGNGDSIFRRLMCLVGRPDMAEDERLKTNAGRVQHDIEVDGAISAWTVELEAAEIVRQLEAAAIPGGLMNSVADMMLDPHFQSRGLFEMVALEDQELVLPAISPKLTQTPGRTDWPGPSIGSHNDEILGQLLGLSESDLKRLEETKIIAHASARVPIGPIGV